MSFWEKIKNGLRRFMEGRSGPDELCFAILIFALVLMLVSSSSPAGAQSHRAGGVCVADLSDVFPKRREALCGESEVPFAALDAKDEVLAGFVRLKNIRKYKYFKCPECHTLAALAEKGGRGHGDVRQVPPFLQAEGLTRAPCPRAKRRFDVSFANPPLFHLRFLRDSGTIVEEWFGGGGLETAHRHRAGLGGVPAGLRMPALSAQREGGGGERQLLPRRIGHGARPAHRGQPEGLLREAFPPAVRRRQPVGGSAS